MGYILDRLRHLSAKNITLLVIALTVVGLLLAISPAPEQYVVYGQGYGYGGGGGGPSPSKGGVRDITTSEGVFTESFTLESEHGDLVISIPEGTTAKTEAGQPISSISITQEVSPPALPEDKAFVGFPFDLEPDGATFDPPITIIFTYDPNKLPTGVGTKSLNIGYYDQDTKKWVLLDAEDITIDPQNNIITAQISHFTYYGVIANMAPAEFTVSDLAISPTEVGIAEEATISVVIANAGDVSGTAQVTLKINGVAVSTQSVKVAGLESRTVSFTTVQGKSGGYQVDIDGLSGTFTVKPPPVGPVVIPSTVPSITAPVVEYPAPTAPAPPAVPAPVPAPLPWPAIIISVVVAVIIATIIVWYYGFRSEY